MKLIGRNKLSALLLSITLLGASFSRAAFIAPGFSGATQYDGWADMTATNLAGLGYPVAPTGDTAWPTQIGSNVSGSGDQSFNKLSGMGFPSDGGGIYVLDSSYFSPVPPYAGPLNGIFSITDATPVANLSNVLFQMYVGGSGAGFYGTPVLNYNGGSQSLAANQFAQLSLTIIPAGPPFGDQHYYELGYQWDLSGIADPITSFEIRFQEPIHTLVFGLQVDQSDTYVQAVPEPSIGLALAAGGAAIGMRRRREALRSK